MDYGLYRYTECTDFAQSKWLLPNSKCWMRIHNVK